MARIVNKEEFQDSAKEIHKDAMTARQLVANLSNGELENYILQRDAVWTVYQKSMFIDSIIHDDDIPDIVIAQTGTGRTAQRVLIEGGQRCNTIESFMHDAFAISRHKDIKPVVIVQPKMVPLLDDNGKPVKEKPAGKKRSVVKMVQAVEDGEQLYEYVSFDMRGKRFSQLPLPLQQKIADRVLNVKVLVNCTPEEIARQMLKYNLGSKMNPVQIGEILSGEKLASWKGKLRNHKLFTWYSTWNEKGIAKDDVERCVTESFVLVNCPDVWKSSNYSKIAQAFVEYASENNLNNFIYIIDEMVKAVKSVHVESYLNSKNLFLIIPLFAEFMTTSYANECFGEFLQDWFKSIKDTTDYTLYDEKSTKSKASIVARLEILKEAMDAYMQEHGYEKSGDETESMEKTTENYRTIDKESGDATDNIPDYTHDLLHLSKAEKREFDTKAMMVVSPYNAFSFEQDDVNKFMDYFKALPSEKQMDIVEDTDFALACLCDYISKAGNPKTFMNKVTVLCLLNTIQFAEREGVSDQKLIGWLREFAENAETDHKWNSVPEGADGYIMGKISVLQHELMQYCA